MLELKWMLLKIKQKFSSTIKELTSLPIQIKIATIVGILLLTLIVITTIGFFQIRTVKYLYTKDTCISHISLLPDIFINSNNDTFLIKNSDYINISNLRLFSSKTCFETKNNPTAGTYIIKTSLLGDLIQKITYKIIVSEPPTINAAALLSKPVVVNEKLKIPISTPDNLYSYQLIINNKSVICDKSEDSIDCDINSLSLEMGKDYDLKLIRLYKNKAVQTMVNQPISTRSRLLIVNPSITNDQVIYDNTKSFSFEFNKLITGSNITLTNQSSNSQLDITTSVADKTIIVSSINDLIRNVNYTLTFSTVTANDGSTLDSVYEIKFKTSDGPSYLSSNFGSYGTELSGTIILTFDQPLSADQDISQYISTNINSSVWKNNNNVYIKYNSTPACSNLSITIKSGIKSNFGFAQSKSWSLSTKILCQKVSIIGVTAQNRSIYAYTFGMGSQTVLFTGAIHGNEYSTKYLMEAWMDELEKNYSNIPADKKIVVIPTINIDGNSTGNRYNANGVDLNRNFPAFDWKTDVYSLTNQLLPGGGGINPLSEPESQALAGYVKNINPKLILSFHSAAGCVIANQAGNSTSLASSYSALSGYRNTTGNSDNFTYPITGSFDDWLRDELNITSVLVELATNSSSEFSRNRSALWAMTNS